MSDGMDAVSCSLEKDADGKSMAHKLRSAESERSLKELGDFELTDCEIKNITKTNGYCETPPKADIFTVAETVRCIPVTSKKSSSRPSGLIFKPPTVIEHSVRLTA